MQFKESRKKKGEKIYVAVKKYERKRETGRKRVSNEETGGACLYENLKLNNYNWSNLKSYPYLRCSDVSLRFIYIYIDLSFLAFALNNCSCFKVGCLEDYYEMGQC